MDRFKKHLDSKGMLEDSVAVILTRVQQAADASLNVRVDKVKTTKWEKLVEYLTVLKGREFAWSSDVATALCVRFAKQNEKDQRAILRTLSPWLLEDAESASDFSSFDCMEPRLCFVDMSEDEKVATFMNNLCADYMTAMLNKGPSQVAVFFKLSDQIATMLTDQEDKLEAGQTLAQPLRDFLDFNVGVKVLLETKAAQIAILDPKQLVRRVFQKGIKSEGVSLMVDALEQHAGGWKPLVKAYRQYVVHDQTLGPIMAKIEKRLLDGDDSAPSDCAEKLSHWYQASRPGGVDNIVDKLMDAMETRSSTLTTGGDVAKQSLMAAQAIEDILNTINVASSGKMTEDQKARLTTLCAQVKGVRISKAVSSQADDLVKAIDHFTKKRHWLLRG